MKWTALAAVLGGVILCLGVVFSFPGPSPSSDLAGYESLWRARDGLPESLVAMETLAGRDDAVGWHACMLASQARVARGEFTIGASWLQRAVALRSTIELRMTLARLLEVAGQRAEARVAWEALLPRSEAVEAMRRLEIDPVTLAGILVRAGRATEALALIGSRSTQQAQLTRARALVALDRPADAAAVYEDILSLYGGNTAVRMEYGQALEQAGEKEKAVSVYHSLGAAGGYAEGLLLESLGRARDAASAYLRSTSSEARWRGAVLLESLGDVGGALPAYRELAMGSSRVHDDAALRAYVLYVRQGEVARAAQMEPWLSPAFRFILGIHRPLDPPPVAPVLAGFPSVRTADQLLRRQDMAWAETELDFSLRGAGPDERLAIGTWYAKHGDYRAAFGIGSGLLSTAASRAAYELAYPLAWQQSVERWAEAYGVDPLLVLAVIREESHYLPTAVSSSDARGLMQLLPSTAQWIARSKLGLPYREEELFEPETNIRLGTWYLGYLLGLFEGDLCKAVAAYNGGQGNVQRWTAAAGTIGPADFPMVLQLTETREYLVKVLDSWLVYRMLYGEST